MSNIYIATRINYREAKQIQLILESTNNILIN